MLRHTNGYPDLQGSLTLHRRAGANSGRNESGGAPDRIGCNER